MPERPSRRPESADEKKNLRPDLEKTVVDSDVRAKLENMVSGEVEISGIAQRELVEKYRPAFLAKGGEHIVYEPKGRERRRKGEPATKEEAERSTVVKVDTRSLEAALDPEGEFEGISEELKRKVVTERLEGEMLGHRRRYAQLKEYFGHKNVLAQREFVQNVPITKALVEQAFGKKIAEKVGDRADIPAIVRIQTKAPEFADSSHASLTAGYAERRIDWAGAYERATDAYLEGEALENTEGALEGVVSDSLRPLIADARRDPELAAVLGDFADKAVAYAKRTGEILDLAGNDNVTLFKEDGAWRYRLVDALNPVASEDGPKYLSDAERAAEKAAHGKKLDVRDQQVLLNAVNFVRAVNGLSREFGSGNVIQIVKPENVGKVDWKQLLKDVK